MAFVQYDPMIQHGEAKVYDEPVLAYCKLYSIKCKGGLPSNQFRGWLRSSVLNRANGRFMYKFNWNDHYDKTGVHKDTYLYQDDVVEIVGVSDE